MADKKNKKYQKQPATNLEQIRRTEEGPENAEPKPPTHQQLRRHIQTKKGIVKPHSLWKDI